MRLRSVEQWRRAAALAVKEHMKITIKILWLAIPAVIGIGLLLLSDHRQHCWTSFPS